MTAFFVSNSTLKETGAASSSTLAEKVASITEPVVIRAAPFSTALTSHVCPAC